MAHFRQWLDPLPSPKGILKNVQKNGRLSLLKTGLPNRGMEAWRLTNLKRLANLLTLGILSIQDKFNLKSQVWANEPINGFRIVLEPNKNQKEAINFPNGLRELNNEELKSKLDNSLKKLCNVDENNWPLAINYATTSHVFGLHVTGKNLPPLELIIPSKKDLLIPSRVIIQIEEEAQIELLQVVLGADNSAQSHLVEIYLGKNASLKHGFLALGDGLGSCLANLEIIQDPGSSYSLTSVQHGWSLSRIEPKIIQRNGQSKTTLNGLQISHSNQQLATHSLVRFNGPKGSLNQVHKAVANGNSHSIFNGIIEVPQIAQETNASQLSRNLLLSGNARIDTKPELEIIADDVKCAHGATVSQLQEDELFYLRSRGINSKQASKLLLKGFCQEIIDELPVEAHRWKVIGSLLKNTN